MFFKNAVEASHHILESRLKEGMTVVDATVGNGKDALFIKKLIGHSGHLYGFDLDQRAVDTTIKRLSDNDYIDYVTLFVLSHEVMKDYISEPCDAVVFNLGYLPGLSRDYITKACSTLESVKQAMDLIKTGGFILIVVYPGHLEGAEESDLLTEFITGIDQKQFHTFEIKYPNQVNHPPYLIYIERRTP